MTSAIESEPTGKKFAEPLEDETKTGVPAKGMTCKETCKHCGMQIMGFNVQQLSGSDILWIHRGSNMIGCNAFGQQNGETLKSYLTSKGFKPGIAPIR